MVNEDFIQQSYKIVDNAIDIYKKIILEELNRKLPLYASDWRKEMNEIINNNNLK